MWCVDQHDKWKYKFGLALHVGLDPFAGRYLWMKVYWTNSNPRLILKYYLDVVEELGCECFFYSSQKNNSPVYKSCPLSLKAIPESKTLVLPMAILYSVTCTILPLLIHFSTAG
jgi:hypothetical protein